MCAAGENHDKIRYYPRFKHILTVMQIHPPRPSPEVSQGLDRQDVCTICIQSDTAGSYGSKAQCVVEVAAAPSAPPSIRPSVLSTAAVARGLGTTGRHGDHDRGFLVSVPNPKVDVDVSGPSAPASSYRTSPGGLQTRGTGPWT